MSSTASAIPDTQLGLTDDEIALLRHHQQIAAAASYGSNSRDPSPASSQGLLLLDAQSLAQLGRHFDRLIQQIVARLEYLSEQSQAVAQQQYDRAGNAIAVADAEISRFHDILRQIDELEADFDRVRHIRDIVRSYRLRIEEMEHQLDDSSSQRHARQRHSHSNSARGKRIRQRTLDNTTQPTQKATGVNHSRVAHTETAMVSSGGITAESSGYGSEILNKAEETGDGLAQDGTELKISQHAGPVPSSTGPFSDSGYASMGPNPVLQKQEIDDDVQTVCTDGQELNIEDEAKEKLAWEFSNKTIQHLSETLSEVNNRRFFSKTLTHLLKNFSIRLEREAKPGKQKDASTFVRHYRQ